MTTPAASDTSLGTPSDRELANGATGIDTSGNARIPVLMEMVGALSRAKDPREALASYARGLDRLGQREGYLSLSVRDLPKGDYRITRLITKAEEFDALETGNPWRNGHTLPVHRGGFLGDVIEAGTPQVFRNVFLRNDPVLGDALAEFGSVMAVPLFDDGAPLNWAVMLRRRPDAFTETDLEEAILRSNLIGTAVRNVLVAQQLREANDRVAREVEQIARIQRALLPQALPAIPGIALGAHYETFDQAGGDLYNIQPLGPDPASPDCPWGIMVADASGHGPAAAVVMAMLYSIMEAYPRTPTGPAEVLEHANDHLVAKRIESSFVTAFLAIYHPRARTLSYARAGHNPPVRMQRDGEAWRMSRLDDVGSVPLGILPDVQYEETQIQLGKDQTIVFYTDGITEAAGPDDMMFGVEGIERSLTTCSGSPECAIAHITQALKVHEAGRRPLDDQTLVILRVYGT